MKSVKIAQFKAELGKYLRFVRRGEEVVVMDRSTPIARVLPLETKGEGGLEIEEPLEASKSVFEISLDPVRGVKTNSLKFLMEERGNR
ncbi:MAG: type II toxin-antitoxin system prevent-host-death family antitoxin [Deltaproteobacteria bacterium]|nr:type II toxin-antitoxin system prevent-host-death family antitoxin [Deltaproteobacteria bacterium]